jgi:glycosyltransferase involved in cell wall biosynthesis
MNFKEIKMKAIAIIPAFNEEKNIENVIYSIKRSGVNIDIVVINDGSVDRTSEISKLTGAYVIDLPINLGIGGAVQTGYIYAYKNNYDVAIQVDGDGQHDGKDLLELISVVENSQADIAIGSRFVKNSNYKSSFSRNIGIRFFSKLVSTIIKQPITDPTSGYRCINQKTLELFSIYYPSDYPEVETIVYAARQGLRIKEVPVNMNQRSHGKSSISLMNGFYYMLKVTHWIGVSFIVFGAFIINI